MSQSNHSIRLGVNIDHIATVRQLRLADNPSPVLFAHIAEQNGADQITCHLREDRRHIQDHDLPALKEAITTSLNIECSFSPDVLERVLAVSPEYICFVPEKRAELTTEGGLDITAYHTQITAIAKAVDSSRTHLSVFIDPVVDTVRRCADLGVQAIELHTGEYSRATSSAQREAALSRLFAAAEAAISYGVRVHAGHGLDYDNVEPILALPGLRELNIGYAIVVQSLSIGWAESVRLMKQKISRESSA